MNELKNRGVQDILIATSSRWAEGLPRGDHGRLTSLMVDACIVHLVRHSLNFCSWKDRKVVAADLRRIYSAPAAVGRGRA
ncbi:MAG: transposase [Paracoccaceae bacterium]